MNGDVTCAPRDYGSTYCGPHDLYDYADCAIGGNITGDDIPAYCYDEWCYVDYDKCILSKEFMYRSVAGDGNPDLFYS